jgi:O-antigen ligase
VAALPIMGFCFVGQFGTLSRSDWVSATAAVMSLVVLFPPGERLKKFVGFILAIPVLLASLWIGTVVLSRFSQSDQAATMMNRVKTVLPGFKDDSLSYGKAWDTRTSGIMAELRIWSDSPLLGSGFAYAGARDYGFGDETSFNHNVWTSTLAKMGLVGLAAYLTPVLGLIVVGRRMVRDKTDKGVVLMGVIVATTGAYMLVLGASTMSFNVERGALVLGILCGVVFRARAMQLQTMQGYAGSYAAGEYENAPTFASDEYGYAQAVDHA